MNIRLISAVTFAMVLGGAVSPVLALDGIRPIPSVRAEIKDQRQELRSGMASRSEQMKEKIKERLTTTRQTFLKKWWTTAARRLQALITRETKLADRIQARIEKAAAAGKDVTAPTAALITARMAIADAQTALTEASGKVADIIANNTPADAFKQLHDLHKGVSEKIRAAQRALIQAVVSLRGLINTPTPSPTPTGN